MSKSGNFFLRDLLIHIRKKYGNMVKILELIKTDKEKQNEKITAKLKEDYYLAMCKLCFSIIRKTVLVPSHTPAL